MKTLLSTFILFFWFLTNISAEKNIAGLVTDKDRIPLVGASILIRHSINGTVTDIDGMFSIDIQNYHNTLEILYTGYGPLTVYLDGNDHFEAVLLKKKTIFINSTGLNSLLKTGTRTVNGLIKNSKDVVLIGGTVLLKKSSTGTVSDIDGEFNLHDISYDSSNRLIFSYAGYQSVEVILGNFFYN